MSDAPATCREAVFDAFRALERRTDREVFRLQEIVGAVLAITTRYPEHTIRTQVSSVMCANAPVHHANHTDDLERVGHGWYRRIVPNPRAGRDRPPERSRANPTRQVSDSRDTDQPWFWEGNVQAAFAQYLESRGWMIESISDTASRQQGADILASKDGQRLVAEVKGYPSDRYARGPRAGQPKPTNPATQARHWYAGALLTASLARDASPESQVVMVFPGFDTFRSLVERTRGTLEAARIGVFFVLENGWVDGARKGATGS